MAPITKERIRELARFTNPDNEVVSVYVDVDGKRYPRYVDVEARVERLLRAAMDGASRGATADIKRVEAHLKKGLNRAHTRGVAIFACEKADLWEVVDLPVPVRDQVVVNAIPHVSQLEAVLERSERFGILLADKQRARMLVFELDELVDKSELFEELPRHDDDAGNRDRLHAKDHIEAAMHAHLKHAAQVAFEAYQREPFEHLIVAAPDEIANELERGLHSYLQERLVGRCPLPVNASEAAIRDAIVEIEERVERDREAQAVERLREAVATANGGVAGLDSVLSALDERRVDRLLVSDGYEAPGWRCRSCGHLGVKAPASHACPVCSEEMTRVDDVVGEAVDEAINQGCRVDVCVNADLDVHGRIGALLRF